MITVEATAKTSVHKETSSLATQGRVSVRVERMTGVEGGVSALLVSKMVTESSVGQAPETGIKVSGPISSYCEQSETVVLCSEGML